MSAVITIDYVLVYVLLPVFIVSVSVGVLMAVRCREDAGLVILAILASAFVVLDYLRGMEAWRSQTALLILPWVPITGYAGLKLFTLNSK